MRMLLNDYATPAKFSLKYIISQIMKLKTREI